MTLIMRILCISIQVILFSSLLKEIKKIKIKTKKIAVNIYIMIVDIQLNSFNLKQKKKRRN